MVRRCSLQTRKVGTAKDPWRWVGYAERTSSNEHSSHNSRSEVGNNWVAWCHPSGFQMWLRSLFYLRTSMIHLPVHLSPKSPLWRWDGCGLAGTTVWTKEITRSLVQKRESGKDAMRHSDGGFIWLSQHLWEWVWTLLLLIKEMHWWVKWDIHLF